MRRRSALVFALLFLVLAPSTSHAQETGEQPAEIRLTLLSQTPWNDPERRDVEVRFRAEHIAGEPLSDLLIVVTLYSRVLSQSAFQSSLLEDPALVIDAETFAREGTLMPGTSRDFELTFPLDTSGIDPDESGVYPITIDLRSGSTSVAELRTPAIFLVREPEVPLALTWTIVLHHPITFDPSGTFTDRSLEGSLSAGGRLHGELRSLRELAKDPRLTPIDLAITPTLLTQLARMRDGYEVAEDGTATEVPRGQAGAALAEQALADLRTIASAPDVSLSTLPFSAPDLPSLYGGGLRRDVVVQLERGRSVTNAFTGASSRIDVLRPPGAALDDATLRALSGSPVRTLLVGPTTVRLPAEPLGFAGPATALLGETGLAAIVPESATEALLDVLADEDPVRAAQVVLGQLATIWQERPGEERGIALLLSEDASFPGPFFEPFMRGVAGAPWLAPVTVGEFALSFPAEQRATLAEPSFRRFPASYVDALKQARRWIGTLRSMLPLGSADPARLETMLLLAEARQFLSNPNDGIAFIEAVRADIRDTIDDLSLDTVAAVSVAADSAGIPITVSNAGEQTLRCTVRLVSQHLREVPTADVRIGPGQRETVRLQVELRSTGRFPVLVQMLSPNGRAIGQPVTVVVRSTTFDRIALVITIGAALALIAIWGRRFLPRRTP